MASLYMAQSVMALVRKNYFSYWFILFDKHFRVFLPGKITAIRRTGWYLINHVLHYAPCLIRHHCKLNDSSSARTTRTHYG